MAINKTTILAAIGCDKLTFGKAGLHHYYLEYNDAKAGIHYVRRDIHVRKLSDKTLEQWATIGQKFVEQVQQA